MSRRVRVPHVVLAVVLAAALTGCGGDDASNAPSAATGADAPPSASSSAPSSSAAPADGAMRIAIENFKFVPDNATVERGQKVTVVNRDSVEHSLTADDGSFDTGLLKQGESKTVTVTKAGANPFHCDPHQYMTGTLTVS